MRRIALMIAALALAGCGGPEPAAKKAEEPKKPAVIPEVYRVKMDTSKGDIVIEVRKEWAPRAAARFHELVQAGYYDDTRFYRVMRGFIAQFGIHGDPRKGALFRDLKFADDPLKLSNKKGTVTFAHNGAHTRAVQVFFNLRDNGAMLDKQNFPAFGKIVEGMDVAGKISPLYGELAPKGAGPDGAKAELQGNAYLDREFPRLDSIRKARVVD